MPDNEEFYVGYFDKAPAGVGSRTRAAVIVLALLAMGAGSILVATQKRFGDGIFEFGNPKEFEGVVRMTPVPHIESAESSDALLVAEFKHGADDLVRDFDGSNVTLQGTLIELDGKRMIEVVGGSIESSGSGTEATKPEPLGNVSLVGQIVDSKCWLGVMKPGDGKVHRECATMCIKGGIPPLFVAHDKDGNELSAVLVSPDGDPVNQEILELIAIPVRVSGALERRGDLLFLRADPRAIERVER